MWTLILLLPVAVIAGGKQPNNIPPSCSTTVVTDSSFDFEKYNQESKGAWTYIKVPDIPLYANLKSLYQVSKPTGREGEYKTTIYQRNTSDRKARPILEELTYDSYNGHITGITKNGKRTTTTKISVIKYNPGRYVYILACSPQTDDTKQDLRYVLAHGRLDTTEEGEIAAYEKAYKFKGHPLRDV